MTEQNNNEFVLDVGLINWDEPVVTELTELSGGTIFAGWKLYRVAVNPFAKDVAKTSFSIPGVYQWREALKEGEMEFPFAPGKTSAGHYLCILVAQCTNSKGEEYQRVKYFKSWGEGEKTEEVNPKNGKPVYKNHQVLGKKLFPALRALPETERAKLDKGETMWAKCVETSAGFSNPSKDGTKTYEFTYYDEWVAYPTQEALRAAEKAHFANIAGSNGASGPDLSNFPELWKNDTDPQRGVDDLFANIRTVKGGEYIAKAKELMLIGPNGKPVNRVNGNEPINLPQLFSQALGNEFPAAMLEDEFSPDKIAEFLKK